MKYPGKDIPPLELEQSFTEKFHAYLHHDLGMFSNDLSGFNYLKYTANTAFNNGWMPRNPLARYRCTSPQCAESLRCRATRPYHCGRWSYRQTASQDGTELGGDFSIFYRTLMQDAFAKRAVNGPSKTESFRLENKAN